MSDREPSVGTGEELGEIDVELSPLAVVLRSRAVVISFVVALFVLGLSIIALLVDTHASDLLSQLAVPVLIVSAMALLLIAALGFSRLPGTYYSRVIRERFRDDHVLPMQSELSFDLVVAELLGPDVAEQPEARSRLTNYAVFDDNRVTFWSRSGTRLLPFLSVPRTSFLAARLDVEHQSRGPSIPIVIVTVRVDGSRVVDMTLKFDPIRSSLVPRALPELREDTRWVQSWVTGEAVSDPRA